MEFTTEMRAKGREARKKRVEDRKCDLICPSVSKCTAMRDKLISANDVNKTLLNTCKHRKSHKYINTCDGGMRQSWCEFRNKKGGKVIASFPGNCIKA